MTQKFQNEIHDPTLVDEFISIVSHELKTPLTSLKAFNQILKSKIDAKSNTNLSGYILRMDSQIDKMTDIINELLDVASLKSGQLSINKESFILDELITNVINTRQKIAQKHKIIKKGLTNTFIESDKIRLSQVLTNLLTNAAKFSPSGTNIIISKKIAGNDIIVSVRDFGIGIPMAKQKVIFQRFNSINNPKSDNLPSMGLGLYISNEILNRLGGRIWVRSSPGKGSTFFFQIPKVIN